MTHHEIKILEDGTRVYSNGTKYKPLTPEQRKYNVRRPDVEGAVMFQREWWLPLVLLSDEGRAELPETRPDTDAYLHMSKPRRCKCDVCRRPEAKIWKSKWRRGIVPSIKI